jgi:hypothetical protein
MSKRDYLCHNDRWKHYTDMKVGSIERWLAGSYVTCAALCPTGRFKKLPTALYAAEGRFSAAALWHNEMDGRYVNLP